MTQLIAGMYGAEFRNTGNLFGLRCGQMRFNDKITHNSGWYNKSGEKLGWGDLSAEDFKEIGKDLEADELFIILSEGDSHWNLVGRNSKENLSVEAPGIDYVAEKAMYIIASGSQFFRIDKYDSEKEPISEQHGLLFRILKGHEVEAFVKNPILP